jgi:drug/metabolite transporter (DMT)-like permease
MRRPHIPPVLILGFGILAVSAASIMIRFAQQEASSLVIAAWRLSLAALVLTPFALAKRRLELASLTRRERGLAVLSGVFLAFHFATWISSLAYTSVASSVVLVSTAPLWVALLSPITLKESVSRPMLGGMLLALIGSVIVGISDTCVWTGSGLVCPNFSEFVRGRAFLGDLLALAGAFTAAGYLIIGRRLRSQISLLSYIFVVYGVGAMILVLVVFITGQSMLGYSVGTYAWLLALALVPQLLGHTSYNWALAYLSAAYVSIAVLGEPIGSSILAYFILNEGVSSLKLFGAVLTLGGIYLASRGETHTNEMLDQTQISITNRPLP